MWDGPEPPHPTTGVPMALLLLSSRTVSLSRLQEPFIARCPQDLEAKSSCQLSWELPPEDCISLTMVTDFLPGVSFFLFLSQNPDMSVFLCHTSHKNDKPWEAGRGDQTCPEK